MTSSSLAGVFSRFHSARPDVWDYREDLQNLAALIVDGGETDEKAEVLDALESLDTFRGEASIRGWLHTLVSGECQALAGREAGSMDAFLDEAVEGTVSLPRPKPGALAAEMALRRRVLDAFAVLPSNYRIALLLKDGHGLTVEQTARLTDSTPAAARSVLYRARHHLRDSLRG